jgi:redox-sensitive bicupin YhaK (pirin superfamily)
MSQTKRVVKIVGPRGQHWVGDGFPVRQMFGYNDLGQNISPFLLLDYAGPVSFPATHERRGVGAHPHRGFETVTIVYSGEVEHRDSVGHKGRIGAGDVQWMTAGAGVLHEEMHGEHFRKVGGPFELVQLWVNLPASLKMVSPRYQTLLATDIPSLKLTDGRSSLRLIAGEFQGKIGPAQTHTQINIWDMFLAKGSRHELKVPTGHTAVLFCLEGSLVLESGKALNGPQLGVLERDGQVIQIEATAESKVLFLGGAPIEEPIVGMGPFVMNSKEELQKAFEDYDSGLFGALD